MELLTFPIPLDDIQLQLYWAEAKSYSSILRPPHPPHSLRNRPTRESLFGQVLGLVEG